MLLQPAELGDEELRVLKEVEELKTKLDWRLREPRRWYGSMRRLALARAIQGSNTIEGFDASLDDAAAVGLGEEPLDTKDETLSALVGYRNAMTFVLQLVGDRDFEYSDQLLKSLHFMMTGYSLENRPGRWRAGPIYVYNEETETTVLEGPDVDDVPILVRELTDSLNNTDEPPTIIRAAMAHLNLVMIHPFRDGNGRMARCLQTLVLGRDGVLDPVFISIEEYLGRKRNTQEYYRVLAEVGGGSWQPGRDTRPWIRFNLTAHLRQAQTMLRRGRETELLWSKLDELTRKHGLPDRTTTALFDGAQGLRVRRGTYRADWQDTPEEISEQTASRDLRELSKAGLLAPHGERRGRYYVGSHDLKAIWRQIRQDRGPRDESDPFANAP